MGVRVFIIEISTEIAAKYKASAILLNLLEALETSGVPILLRGRGVTALTQDK